MELDRDLGSCLIKFNPTKGYVVKILEFMMKLKEGETTVLFMADNLYLCGRSKGVLKYYSMDGIKMEKSHFKGRDTDKYKKFILDFYDLEDNPTIKAMYEHFFDNTVVGAKAVLGDRAVTVPMLSSGVCGTAQFNTMKMAQVTANLLNLW